jgi:hypothetical protein
MEKLLQCTQREIHHLPAPQALPGRKGIVLKITTSLKDGSHPHAEATGHSADHLVNDLKIQAKRLDYITQQLY